MRYLFILITITFMFTLLFATAITKEDLYDNKNIIDTFVVYDPYPSRIWDMGIWLAERRVKYTISKYVNAELLHMYVISIIDYGDTDKQTVWAEATRLTGTSKSMLLDINNDFKNEYFLKALGL